MGRADIFVARITHATTPTGGVYMTSATLVDVMHGTRTTINPERGVLGEEDIFAGITGLSDGEHNALTVHVVDFSVIGYMVLYSMLFHGWTQHAGGGRLGEREFYASTTSEGKISAITALYGGVKITLKSVIGVTEIEDDEQRLVYELRRMRVRRMTGRGMTGFLLSKFSRVDEDTGEELYPALDVQRYSFLSAAGRQGWKTARPGDYGRLESWDYPSAYPTLLSTIDVPYGLPRTTEAAAPTGDWWVGEVLMSWRPRARIAPWFYPQRDFTGAVPVDEGDFEECFVTSDELAALRLSHDVEIYGWGRVDNFSCAPWRGAQSRFWWWCRRQKKIGRGAVEKAAKLAINATVGCYGRPPTVKRHWLEIDPVTRSLAPKKEYLQTPRPASYWPIYGRIVGAQRRRMVDLAVQIGGDIAYAHTDGVLVDPRHGPICERAGLRLKARYVRARVYEGGGYIAETFDGRVEYALQGLERGSLDGLTYDEVTAGPVEVVVKSGKLVPGGKRIDYLLGRFNPISGGTEIVDDFGGKIDISAFM